MNAETFNSRYPVGTPVFAYPGFRPEDDREATRLVTRTRTKAQTSASGDPVVWVEGEGSYICLTHVDVVSETVYQAAKKAERTAAAVAAAKPKPASDDPRDVEIAHLQRKVASLKAEQDRDDAEYAEAIKERDRALEALEFQERNSLPELRRQVEHHKDGKQRWRERAEKAEARVAELEAERHTTNEALDDAVQELRSRRDNKPAATCRCNEPDADPYACEADDCEGEFSELNPFGGSTLPVEKASAEVSKTCGCGWRTSVWHVDDGSAEEELHRHVTRCHDGTYTQTAEEAS